MSKLRIASSPEWLEAVLGDFDAFLVDHAACERKASATALTLISHYPDRELLVRDMLGTLSPMDHSTGSSSLSTTHLWFVISMPSIVMSTM